MENKQLAIELEKMLNGLRHFKAHGQGFEIWVYECRQVEEGVRAIIKNLKEDKA